MTDKIYCLNCKIITKENDRTAIKKTNGDVYCFCNICFDKHYDLEVVTVH